MSTIPASTIVNIQPGVLAAGGAGLDLIGLCLTRNTRVPVGTVQSFPTALAVGNYFGLSSVEAEKAAIYFGGFRGSNVKPGAMLFAQYNSSAVAAYLRGGNVSALTVAQLQGLSGTLTVTIDATPHTASVDLSTATSFSNAAEIIGNALGIEGVSAATFTGAMSGTTLTASSVTGAIGVGDVIVGSGVTSGTYIVAQLTGPVGGAGTYTISASQTVASEAMTAFMPGVQYDSVSGGFIIISGTTGGSSTISYGSGALATSLMLTLATGAILSQGAAAASPAAFMNALIQVNRAWATFFTMFDPDNGSGNTVKQAFAAWKNTQNNRYGYVCWDTDITPTESVPATSSLGYILNNNADSGTCLAWEPSDLDLAAFISGAAASIDFTQTNGRITFAFKWQDGLTAGVSDATIAANLAGNPQSTSDRGNGYNFGGVYAAAAPSFSWLQRGFVTGPFKWFDSYVNQIWLNAQFQNAILTLFSNAKSVPYDAAGNSLIDQALADPIAAGLNFGAYAPGTISLSQAAQVNNAAGANISDTLQTQGYYLQIQQASSEVRAARASPPCTFWYLDRGSVQALSLASIAVQ